MTIKNLKLKIKRDARAKVAAFTLVELLVSITILSVIIGFAAVNFSDFRERQNFDLDAQLVAEALRNTQGNARQGENGTDWGVRFTSESSGGYFEIFSGSSYDQANVKTRTSLSDASLFSNPAQGSTKTILFSAISGLPSTGNTVVIQKNYFDGEAYVITVNSLGKISKTKETGLLGMWLLDEATGSTAHDASGNNISGTLQNFSFSGSSNWVSLGKAGGALSFDGGTNAVNLGTSITPTSSATFMAWVYPRTNSGEHKILDKRNNYNATSGYSMFFSGTSLFLEYGNGTTYAQKSKAVSSYSTNAWHHVAVTLLASSTITYYFDGQNLGTQTGISGGIASNAISAAIGYSLGRSMGGFDATIDEVRMYNRALSDSEIQNIYELH